MRAFNKTVLEYIGMFCFCEMYFAFQRCNHVVYRQPQHFLEVRCVVHTKYLIMFWGLKIDIHIYPMISVVPKCTMGEKLNFIHNWDSNMGLLDDEL